MPLLSKEDLLKKSKRTYKDVEIPELGGTVRVASMSAASSIALNAIRARQAKGEEVNGELMLAMVQGSIVDEQGEQMFSDTDAAAFFKVISVDTFNLLMEASLAPEALAKLKLKQSQLGNSEASPSAA